MKKLLLALLLIPSFAFAGGSSQASPSDDATTTSLVSFKKYPRTLQFTSAYHALAIDGSILVCIHPNKPPDIWNYKSECFNSRGENAWQLAQNINVPGFELTAYELRFPGQTPHRQLILYFSKK